MIFHSLHALFCRPPALGAPEPDFLCVGMEKAATGWLYDQLKAHPDFWMPPVKELRYLHMGSPAMDDVVRAHSQQKARRRKEVDAAGQAFLAEAATLVRHPRDFRKYGMLFRFKGVRLSGDISPGYWRLRQPDIDVLAAQFPRLKVLLMVRDPVERAWSHISMQHRRGAFDSAILENVAVFARWFARSPLKRASLASKVPPRWAESAPAIPFRHFFFDDVVSAPKTTRDEIVGFLGGHPRKKEGNTPADYNRKAGFAKLPLTASLKAVLVENLAEELRESARVFGGPAEAWPARYGL